MKRVSCKILAFLLVAIQILSLPVFAGAAVGRASLEPTGVMDLGGGANGYYVQPGEMDQPADIGRAGNPIPIINWSHIVDHPGYDIAYTQVKSAYYNGIATENHVVIDNNEVRFFGYYMPPYLDMCYNSQYSIGLTSLEFTLRPQDMTLHVFRETGAFFNGYFDSTYSTYTGYYLALSRPNTSSPGSLALYYLNNETMNYNNFNPGPRVPLTPAFITGITDACVNSYEVNIVRDPSNGAFTINIDEYYEVKDIYGNVIYKIFISNHSYAVNNPLTNAPGFGFMAGNFSHNCKELTRVYYSDVTITVGDPIIDISIEKWVDDMPITEWWRQNGHYNNKDNNDTIPNITRFNLYKVDGYGAPILDENFIASTYLSNDGMIEFGDCITEQGWYAITEILLGGDQYIFEQPDPLYIYIDESLKFDSGPRRIHSKENDGRISLDSKGDVKEIFNDPVGGIPFIVDFWKNNMHGYSSSNGYSSYFDADAKFIWDDNDGFKYGEIGSHNTFKIMVNASQNEAFRDATLTFACDNAAIVRLNVGSNHAAPAGYTIVAFDGKPVVINTLTYSNFNGEIEAWSNIYTIPIKLRPGMNIIDIEAANSIQTHDTNTPNDWYDKSNNPVGLVFQLDAPGIVFENKTLPKPDYVCEVIMDGNPPIGYYSLDAALATIGPAKIATIRLLKNIDYIKNTSSAALDIDGGRDITFDMNGLNLNIVNNGSGRGLNVLGGAKVRIGGADPYNNGDLNVYGGHCGLYVSGRGSMATVTNSKATGKTTDNFKVPQTCGVYVGDGNTATVLKDVELKREDIYVNSQGHGAYAMPGATLLVEGDVVTYDPMAMGVYGKDATITVGGNATGGSYGAVYADGGNIYIVGNAYAGEMLRSIGAAMADKGGKVTIDGIVKFVVGSYARVDGEFKDIGDITIPTTKPGYRTYEKNYGIILPLIRGSVWVKDEKMTSIAPIR